MKLDAHGGDLLAMASVSKRDPASLLDFSVNVRPEGAPEFLRAALVRANTGLAAYPSPNAEEALAAAARRYGLPAGRFAFGNGSNELIHALARVLDDLAHAALDREDPQQLEDDVLRTDIGPQTAGQLDPDDLGIGDVVGAAAHRDRDVQTARADREAADAARGGGVAVAADQGLAGGGEPLKVNLMADAVAGAGIPHPDPLCDRADEDVVVGVLKPVLQRVVVDISNRELGAYPGNPHGLKLEVGHRPGRVLRQGLVDPQPDLRARLHLAVDKVRGDDFLCDTLSHPSPLNLPPQQ